MNVLVKLAIASTALCCLNLSAEKLHFAGSAAVVSKVLGGNQIAVIKADRRDQVEFFADQISLSTVTLQWPASHIWALPDNYVLVAALKIAPNPAAPNQAVLIKDGKILKEYQDVRNIHQIAGSNKFALEVQQAADSKDTLLHIIDPMQGVVKSALIPQSSKNRKVSVAPDLSGLVMAPFSTDASSVSELTFYSGDKFDVKQQYSFASQPIYQAVAMTQGLVVINQDRKLVAKLANNTRWQLPDANFSFRVDMLSSVSNPACLLIREDSGRIAVVDRDGTVLFDSAQFNNKVLNKILENGAAIDVVDQTLVVNDTDAGDALLIELSKPHLFKRLQAAHRIQSLDPRGSVFTVQHQQQLKIEQVK